MASAEVLSKYFCFFLFYFKVYFIWTYKKKTLFSNSTNLKSEITLSDALQGNILWQLLNCYNLIKDNIYTYIHNWPLKSFSQDYCLASYTTHVVGVNFIREWRDLQSNVGSERQIFEKLFHRSLFTFRVFARNRVNIFHISFLMTDTNQAFASNKSTHYILDHGDFKDKLDVN